MKLAILHFSKIYSTVTDVSSRAPYDLLCSKEGKELHVEVKGTTTEGGAVILTRNEVHHSREANYSLFVVRNIELHNANSPEPIATGGSVRIFNPWQASEHELKPISYECILDISKSQEV